MPMAVHSFLEEYDLKDRYEVIRVVINITVCNCPFLRLKGGN